MLKIRKKGVDTPKTSPTFIKQIAAVSASENFGVVGMGYKNNLSKILDVFCINSAGSGIKVKYLDDENVELDIYVIMEFGTRLIAVAESLIDSVKYNVEKQTDAIVKKVNIYVQYVRV